MSCPLLYLITEIPTGVIEWVTLLLRVREVPISNLGPETGHADLDFTCFSSSLQPNTIIAPQIRPRPLLPTSFPIHYSLIVPSFDTV
jgi:hypothetical protein